MDDQDQLDVTLNLEECTVAIKFINKKRYCSHVDLDYEDCIEFRDKLSKAIEKINIEHFTSRCF